jgi:hypothetical protein
MAMYAVIQPAFVDNKVTTIVPVQPIAGGKPQKAKRIFGHVVYRTLRQTIGYTKMCNTVKVLSHADRRTQ